jgi:hypothetical protein
LHSWIVVLVCYLDDSGKDPQNAITTLAGYAAGEDQWRGFEIEVEPIFADCGVKVLHTKDLHKTDGEFEGWRVLQKQAFVARICRALSHDVPLGVSASAAKEIYAQRATESGRKKTITPYAWCFNLIIEWILTDIRVGRIAHADECPLSWKRDTKTIRRQKRFSITFVGCTAMLVPPCVRFAFISGRQAEAYL